MSTPTTSGGVSPSAGILWVLRRFGLVLLLPLSLLPIGAAFAQSRQIPIYQGEALVVASELALDTEALPGYAEAVFSSGEVARTVASDPRLAVDAETVIPDKLQVLTPGDSVAIKVVSQDHDPEVAAELANRAAETYVQTLNRAGPGVGVFALQDQASVPTRPVIGAITMPLALAGGALAGVALASLLVVLVLIRRPMITTTDVERLLGLPVYGMVELPKGTTRDAAWPRGVPGISTVTRHILEAAPSAVLVTSPPQAAAARRWISMMLAISLHPFRLMEPHLDPEMLGVLERQLRRRTRTGGDSSGHPSHDAPLLLVDGVEPLQIMDFQDYSRCTLLLVEQGTTSNRMRLVAAEYLEGELDAVILYRLRRGRFGLGRARRTSTTRPANEDRVGAEVQSAEQPRVALGRSRQD